jgi:hypothetical protein
MRGILATPNNADHRGMFSSPEIGRAGGPRKNNAFTSAGPLTDFIGSRREGLE